MYIQHRLMDEQLRLWCNCGLGKSLLKGNTPKNVDEFRSAFPLTDYSDYAEILLAKRADMLPGEPVVWIQTTWEGGLRPIKLAPYTRGMLDTYKRNLVATAMLASGRSHGDFSFKKGDRILYGGAPLPYATGLIPSLLNEEIDIAWLPDSNTNSGSFSERMKKGFEMAMNGGIDYFFAIGSVANYITENFGKSAGISKKPVHPYCRQIPESQIHKPPGRASYHPGDIFHLKGMISAGTDANCYKKILAKAWGITPLIWRQAPSPPALPWKLGSSGAWFSSRRLLLRIHTRKRNAAQPGGPLIHTHNLPYGPG